MRIMNRSTVVAVCVLAMCSTAVGQEGRVGAGNYVTSLPAGAKGPQEEIFRTLDLKGPMPTNDWWSSLAWMKLSERAYPHPLAVCAESGGLRVFAPAKITANKDAIFGFMPDRSPDDLVLGRAGAAAFAEARVESFSDWF